MKKALFPMFLGFTILMGLYFIPNTAYADEILSTERGVDFEKTRFIGDDGLLYETWASKPQWILDYYDGQGKPVYKPYRLFQDDSIVQVETALGSFVFDKNKCAISFYNAGNITPLSDPVIKSDSYVVKGTVIGSDNFVNVNSVNNAQCQTIVIESGNDVEVQGIKHVDNVGTFKIRYIKQDGKPLKTQLEPTNLNPSWNNHKLGITQTMHVPYLVRLGDVTYDLRNYNNTVVDRDWLINHKSDFIQLSDRINFDFDLGFQYVNKALILWDGVTAKLAFDYTYNTPQISPGQTLIIDPQFGYSVGTHYNIESTAAVSGSCNNSPYTKSSVADYGNRLGNSAASDTCIVAAIRFNTTSISDSATIVNATYRFDVTGSTNSLNCDITQLTHDPTTIDAETLWNDVRNTANGTTYVSNTASCLTGTNVVIDLGTSADSDIQTSLTTDNEFSIGHMFTEQTREGGVVHQTAYDDGEIQITYLVIPDAITDLSGSFLSSPFRVNVTWTEPFGGPITGYNIQRNCGAGWSTIQNDTGSTTTFYIDSSLCQNMWHAYNVTSWSIPGQSAGSNIANVTTNANITASVTFEDDTVGDVIQINGTVTVTTLFPNGTLNTIKLYKNNVLVETETSGVSVAGGYNETNRYWQLNQAPSDVFRIDASISNSTGTLFNITNSITRSIEYDPEYNTAIDPDEGLVNYTDSRTADQEIINLKVNRDKNGATFSIECLYQTSLQAIDRNQTLGTWHNFSNVGYLNDTFGDAEDSHYYISCYNDGELFTTVSYTNSSLALLGIQIFDETYGTFLGVPAGIFFIVMAASMASNRTAPIWIVVILGIAGLMATIGFFTVDSNVWALALVAGMLGLFVGRKLF